jgi:hypothetical protein
LTSRARHAEIGDEGVTLVEEYAHLLEAPVHMPA